jgi:hypothetical protein
LSPNPKTSEQYHSGMARQTQDHELTDEEIVSRLREAEEDAQAGRLVSCETEDDLRAFFGPLRSVPE